MKRLLKKIIHKVSKGKKVDLVTALQGKNVYCNCCGGEFITFLPFGLVKRANAMCPACGSLERHRLYWHYLDNELQILNKLKTINLLHVAPEPVLFKKFIKQSNIKYVPCAKFDKEHTDHYPDGTQNIDITQISLPKDTFDAIICSHVLEHIPDDFKAMQELYRVLKPGGWALLQVPLDVNREVTYEDFSITDPTAREKAFGQYDHVRIYGKDYSERLSRAGFVVKEIKYTERFTALEIFKYGLSPNESIFYCKKE